MITDNIQFVVTGYSSNVAQEAMENFAKDHVIFGTYNSNKPNIKNKNIHISSLDLQNEDDVKNFIASIQDNLKKVVVVNFAAFKEDSLLANQNLESWEMAFSINVSSNFLIAKYLLPIMLKNKWGRFIHISSERAIRGSVGSTAYSSSKAALQGLSRSMAKEYARFGISSNVLRLGYFDSGLYRKLDESIKKEFIKGVPSKKLGAPDDIYHAINYLVLSNYTNGSIITIDRCME